MKLTTACAKFVTIIVAIASQFDVVASSSVLDDVDPPQTRKVQVVRPIIILYLHLFNFLSLIINVSDDNFILSFAVFSSYSFRCDDDLSQYQDQERQEDR